MTAAVRVAALDSRAEFAPPSDWVGRFGLPDCDDTLYVPHFVEASAMLCERLDADLEWRDENIRLFGRSIRAPRRSACYGDAGVVYRYSNVAHAARPWPPLIRDLHSRLQRCIGARFNFVLANRYRDGSDSMGWHSDDERELGPSPIIASISFGATRPFRFRARDDSGRRAAVALECGSLLLMWGRSQRCWQHALPKVRAATGLRINLTFRDVRPRP